jgi:hypothetical protein
MKGAHERARRKAAMVRLAWRTEGIGLEGRDRETLPGMKGWRPSASKARAGSGFFKRTYSCRTSDRSPCLSPGSSVPGLDPGMPAGRHSSPVPLRLAAAKSDGHGVQAIRDRKAAPALHSLHEAEDPETKREGRQTIQAQRFRGRARSRPEAGAKNEKARKAVRGSA